MRRSTGRRATTAVLTGALVTTLLAGCPSGTRSTGQEPDEVDEARAQELLDDPWLDAFDVTMTRPANGTDGKVHPTSASVYREAPDGLEQALISEVAGARPAGWWPYYAQCSGVSGGVPTLHGRMGVVLAKELTDGSYAQVVLEAGAGQVEILATAANHAVEQPPVPAEVDVTSIACLAANGIGPDAVGAPVVLTQDW